MALGEDILPEIKQTAWQDLWCVISTRDKKRTLFAADGFEGGMLTAVQFPQNTNDQAQKTNARKQWPNKNSSLIPSKHVPTNFLFLFCFVSLPNPKSKTNNNHLHYTRSPSPVSSFYSPLHEQKLSNHLRRTWIHQAMVYGTRGATVHRDNWNCYGTQEKSTEYPMSINEERTAHVLAWHL